tara:strand:- start:97 stop:558 length:462 start_codon:yes stop_codon:yes gene_type:complete
MKKIIAFFIVLITSGCGFKVVNIADLNNFNIAEITTDGDKRINYKIKNRLLFNSNNNEENQIVVNLFTKKNKVIKEKNIKNEITKYRLSLLVDVKFNSINKTNEGQFSVNKGGDYNVASQYSQTLNNEKKLIDLLANELADEILERLRLVNDL